jgi:hypothetical protein
LRGQSVRTFTQAGYESQQRALAAVETVHAGFADLGDGRSGGDGGQCVAQRFEHVRQCPFQPPAFGASGDTICLFLCAGHLVVGKCLGVEFLVGHQPLTAGEPYP